MDVQTKVQSSKRQPIARIFKPKLAARGFTKNKDVEYATICLVCALVAKFSLVMYYMDVIIVFFMDIYQLNTVSHIRCSPRGSLKLTLRTHFTLYSTSVQKTSLNNDLMPFNSYSYSTLLSHLAQVFLGLNYALISFSSKLTSLFSLSSFFLTPK